MPGTFDRTRRFLTPLTDDPDAAATRMAALDVDLVAARLTPSVEIALALTATLLLRLDQAAPRIHLDIPMTRSTGLPRLGPGLLLDELAADHVGFTSVERLDASPSKEPTLRLIFDGDDDGLRIDTAGWSCSVGEPLPEMAGNPISAAFAAVLASSEVLKVALEAAGSKAKMRPWRGVVSLWDYTLNPVAGPAIADPIDLNGVAFVGCGGVASAAAWVLGLLQLAGAPLAIDKDGIDDTNLNRHLTASLANLGDAKAELLAALLRVAGADPVVEEARWEALEDDRRLKVDLGVISVDDDAVRRSFQLDMPRLILNGGTSDSGLYQVTRHDFLNEACLGCIARADLQTGGPEETLARRLGLRLDELEPHLKGAAPLPDQLLAQLAPDEAD